MELFLYNSLHRKKEKFEPHNWDTVKLYSCWPTVYWDPHIGNMRAYVFVDLLKSSITYVTPYKVNHVMNITDVGHLTDDGDHGEDKMEKWARRENKTVREVARMYEKNFRNYSEELWIDAPDTYTRATEYIQEQIDMVKTLTEKWYTYVIDWDGIYMDTSKVDEYGKLAQLDFEWMNSDHRWDGAKIDSSKKKNLSDFALWKFSPKHEQRSMEWVYNWKNTWALIVSDDFNKDTFLESSNYQGSLRIIKRSEMIEEEINQHGFPWRHIECSAMATKELGDKIDIHTWWVDHIPVHHTNEIAQAECCIGTNERVKFWMHVQFLQIDGWKVSKSKWDDLSIPWIIEKWFEPQDLRYFYFTGHYRSFLDFTWEALEAAQKTRKNLIKKILKIQKENHSLKEESNLKSTLQTYLADDLDTVKVLSSINSALANPQKGDVETILEIDDKVLKLWLREGIAKLTEKENTPDNIPAHIVELANQRQEAKLNKEYQKADELRDKITSEWRDIKDSSEGYKITRTK